MAIAVEMGSTRSRAVVQELDQPRVQTDDLGKTARIKIDLEDRRREFYENGAAALTSLPLFAFAAGAVLGGGLPFIPCLLPTSYFYLKFYKNSIEQERAEKHSIINETLGYRADRFVYRGKGLKIGRVELRNGDNFYRLKLLEIGCKDQELSPEQEEVIGQSYTYCLDDFRKKTSQRDYRAVVIDAGRGFIRGNLLAVNTHQVRREEFFEGKDVSIDSPDTPVAVLSKEVFDMMSLKPEEVFEQAVDALEQAVGRKINVRLLIQRLRELRLKVGEELFTEAKNLSKELDHLFDSEVDGRFNGLPETFIDRTQDVGYARRKVGVHPRLSRIRSSRGDFLQQVTYTQGDKRTLLRLDRSLEEAMSLNPRDRALFLADAISRILKSPKILREVAQPVSLSPIEIHERLKELGLEVGETNNEVIHPKPKRFAYAVKNGLLAMVLTGIMITGGKATVEAINSQSSESSIPPYCTGPACLGEYQRPNFDEVKPNLLWKVEDNTKPESELKANGYFITSTASVYIDGKWILNNDLENAVLLDNQELSKANDQSSNIVIASSFTLDKSGNANFKLPIRDRSTLYRLSIVDANGKSINQDAYKVYKLEDGTFEVKISLGATQASAFIQVKEVLIWSDNSVHARKQIPPIDTNRLEDDVLELLRSNGQSQEQLASAIRNGTYPSGNPSNKEILDSIDGSPESYINAANDLNGKDCDTANTEYALLSSAIDSEKYVNIAIGYGGAKVNSRNTKHLYIDNSSGHGFTITNKGDIIDATPKASQPQLLPNVNDIIGNIIGPDLDVAWSQREAKLRQQSLVEESSSQTQEDFKLLSVLITTAIVLALAPKGIGITKKHLTKEKIDPMVSKLKPGKYNLEKLNSRQLEEAYKVLNWLCYGENNLPTQISSTAGFQNLSEFLQRARGGLTAIPIKAYLRNPKPLERKLGVTDPKILRQLARLIISE